MANNQKIKVTSSQKQLQLVQKEFVFPKITRRPGKDPSPNKKASFNRQQFKTELDASGSYEQIPQAPIFPQIKINDISSKTDIETLDQTTYQFNQRPQNKQFGRRVLKSSKKKSTISIKSPDSLIEENKIQGIQQLVTLQDFPSDDYYDSIMQKIQLKSQKQKQVKSSFFHDHYGLQERQTQERQFRFQNKHKKKESQQISIKLAPFDMSPMRKKSNTQRSPRGNIDQRSSPSLQLDDVSRQVSQFQNQMSRRLINLVASEENKKSQTPPSSSSSLTQDEEEEFNVWDNKEIQERGLDIEQLSTHNRTEEFLLLYKMRYGMFPTQREKIDNEKVLQYAQEMTQGNRRTYLKYFGNPQKLNFQDQNDYSQPLKVSDDENFKRYQAFVQDSVSIQKRRKKSYQPDNKEQPNQQQPITIIQHSDNDNLQISPSQSRIYQMQDAVNITKIQPQRILTVLHRKQNQKQNQQQTSVLTSQRITPETLTQKHQRNVLKLLKQKFP